LAAALVLFGRAEPAGVFGFHALSDHSNSK